MSGYQSGDHDAAARLIESLTPLLRRYFLVRVSERRYADDLLQETWMRIHKARHSYRRGEPVLPWIFAIARHTSLDAYRKARRVETHEQQVASLPEPAQFEPAPDRTGPDIDAMLAALPESQREVIVLLKIFGMTIEEVARATSSSPGSVKQKAFRAYQKLRDVLTLGMSAR
jgi:RNA polymerase sigma-70 factor (ECF subfamily)